MDRKQWGFGGLLLVAGAFIGRETLSWLFAKLLDALTAGQAATVTWATFPWVNLLGLILMGMGLYIILKSDKRAERNAALAGRMRSLYIDLDHCIDIEGGSKVYPEIMGEATALCHELEGLGISTPYCIEMDLRKTYRTLRTYLGALRPMIEANQIELAKQEAPKIIKGAGVAESRPRLIGKPKVIPTT